MLWRLAFWVLFVPSAYANPLNYFKRFQQISEHLAVSSQIRDEQSVCALKDAGYTIIFSFQGGDLEGAKSPMMKRLIRLWEAGETKEEIQLVEEFARKHGIQFFSIPINSRGAVTAEQEERINYFLRLLKAFTNQSSSGAQIKILGTCAHGRDRSRFMMALHLAINEGRDPTEVYADWGLKSGRNWIRRLFTGKLDNYFWERVESGRDVIVGLDTEETDLAAALCQGSFNGEVVQ